MTTVVKTDAASVAAAVAEIIQHEVEAGSPTIGLAGGTTPKAAYALLRDMDLDWSETMLWLSDERWVPPDDADSNGLMVRRAFADATGARLLRPDYSLGDPEDAARTYTKAITSAFGPRGAPELVLLGLGDDGHTASLFPGTEALSAEGERYVENWVPEQETWRLTSSLGLLWAARELVFVVTGTAKAETLRNVVDRRLPLPARRVAAGANQVTWLVDEDAAAKLNRGA